MPSRSFSLLLVLVLLAGGSLGCYKGFCPACAEATPVQRLSYPLQSTFTVGVAIAALAPDPQGGQPQTYAVVDGALPPGLTLDPATGLITGTATTPGLYRATIQAGNLGGAVTEELVFTELSAPSAVSLMASPPNPLYGETSVTVTPAFTGAASAVVGTVPGGNDLSANAVSGTPIPVQASGFTTATTCWLRAANAAGDFVEASLTIAPQTVRLTPVSPADATRTVETVTAFSADVSGGALGTVTWRASAGTIDPGTGAWTAPDAPTTATITAFSDDNGAVTASTSVTVVAAATASLAASSENPLYEQTSVTVTPTFTGAASAVLA